MTDTSQANAARNASGARGQSARVGTAPYGSRGEINAPGARKGGAVVRGRTGRQAGGSRPKAGGSAAGALAGTAGCGVKDILKGIGDTWGDSKSKNKK